MLLYDSMSMTMSMTMTMTITMSMTIKFKLYLIAKTPRKIHKSAAAAG